MANRHRFAGQRVLQPESRRTRLLHQVLGKSERIHARGGFELDVRFRTAEASQDTGAMLGRSRGVVHQGRLGGSQAQHGALDVERGSAAAHPRGRPRAARRRWVLAACRIN